MNRALLALSFSALLLLPSIAADTTTAPENIFKHYEWCGLAKDTATLISRYEGFWSHYHPKNEEYQDAIDVRFVRLCAYRLAALYADSNNPKKCREMLVWLEAQDQALTK